MALLMAITGENIVQGIMALTALGSMGVALAALMRTSGRALRKDAREEGEEVGRVATIISEYSEKFERAFSMIASIDDKRQEHEKLCAKDKALFAQSLQMVSASQERLLNRFDSMAGQVTAIARRRADRQVKRQLGTE